MVPCFASKLIITINELRYAGNAGLTLNSYYEKVPCVPCSLVFYAVFSRIAFEAAVSGRIWHYFGDLWVVSILLAS